MSQLPHRWRRKFSKHVIWYWDGDIWARYSTSELLSAGHLVAILPTRIFIRSQKFMSGWTMTQRWVCPQLSRYAMGPFPVFLYHWLFKLIGLLLKMKYPDIYKQEKLSLVENSNLQFISCSNLWALVPQGYQFFLAHIYSELLFWMPSSFFQVLLRYQFASFTL